MARCSAAKAAHSGAGQSRLPSHVPTCHVTIGSSSHPMLASPRTIRWTHCRRGVVWGGDRLTGGIDARGERPELPRRFQSRCCCLPRYRHLLCPPRPHPCSCATPRASRAGGRCPWTCSRQGAFCVRPPPLQPPAAHARTAATSQRVP